MRPLKVFGAAFKVELSTCLTLSPDTVIRAATGKGLLAWMRTFLAPSAMKQFRYGELGKHHLSTTSKSSLVREVWQAGQPAKSLLSGVPPKQQMLKDMGWLGELLAGRLEGNVEDALRSCSAWQLVASTWGSLSGDHPLDALVREMVRLDLVAAHTLENAQLGVRHEARQDLDRLAGAALKPWSLLLPDLTPSTALLLDSTLLGIAQMERAPRIGDYGAEASESKVLSLLNPRRKPLGNWFSELQSAVGCKNNQELASLLFRQNKQMGDQFVSRDRLKKWASVQPKNLMPVDGMKVVCSTVANATARNRLESRFLVARFLTFLVDMVRSSVESPDLSWGEAQMKVRARYQAIYRTT